MKTIEAPLTLILVVLCLGFITKHHMDEIKRVKEEAKQAIELKKIEIQIAKKEAEIAERTINVEVVHDGDPKTNTHNVTVSAGGDDSHGDDFEWSWEQEGGDRLKVDGLDTEKITFEAEPGKYKFVLTLTDVYGAACTEYVIVDIAPEPNECPKPTIDYSNNYVAPVEDVIIDETSLQTE